MRLIIKTLQLLGFWSHPDYGHSSRRAVFLILAVTVCLLIPGLAFIFRHEPDIASAMGCFIEVVFSAFVIPQATIFMIHRRLLEQTFDEINSALAEAATDPHRDVQTVLRKLETFSSWIFKGYFGSEIASASLYILSIPVIILVQFVVTGILPPLRAVLEVDYIIFEHRCNLILWLATFVVTLAVSLHLMAFLSSSHCFFWSLLHNICGLFKIVAMKIARLDEFTDKILRHEELVDIVCLQEAAYRSARAMEKALNVLMLILYGTCVIDICMAMTTLTLASEDRALLIKMVLVLIYTLVHIFMYSLLGTEIIYASTSAAEEFYATRWYQLPIFDQHNILFALTRSQKMAVLTTGKFFFISRITFGMTLRTAVQYFTVLRQVYGSQ